MVRSWSLSPGKLPYNSLCKIQGIAGSSRSSKHACGFRPCAPPIRLGLEGSIVRFGIEPALTENTAQRSELVHASVTLGRRRGVIPAALETICSGEWQARKSNSLQQLSSLLLVDVSAAARLHMLRSGELPDSTQHPSHELQPTSESSRTRFHQTEIVHHSFAS